MTSPALSFKCDVCGCSLRNMSEVKEHGEASGHASVSESVEAVLQLVCTDCGKPCRTATEQDVHTKRTGHASFADKTAEAAKPVDTEVQVRALRAEEVEEAGVDCAMLDAVAPEEDGGAGAELVTPEVPQALLEQLTCEFGFSEHTARRALYFTGTDSVEVAVAWMADHGEEADVDQPLLVPKAKLKVKLSKEEARAQAEALRRTVLAKREKEEKESERLREKERVRSGKELLAAKRTEEDQERRRNIAWRQREKEEEAKARDRIKQKLDEDKAARRRKLGLPEEPTPEELAAEGAKAAAKAGAEAERKAAAATAAAAVRPVSVAEKLRAELVVMKRACADEPERHKAACGALFAYVGNVARAPEDLKYRRIRLANAAFQQRVGALPGGMRFLELCGFQELPGGEFLELAQAKLSLPVLHAAGAEIQNALDNPFFGVL